MFYEYHIKLRICEYEKKIIIHYSINAYHLLDVRHKLLPCLRQI